MKKPSIQQLTGEFHPKRLFPSLAAGVISGILTVMIEISLAALFFSGNLSHFVTHGGGKHLGLRKMNGKIVREMSLYTGPPATASVIAGQLGDIYFLSNESLKEMEIKDPKLTAALHKFIAQLLNERLTYSNQVVEARLE